MPEIQAFSQPLPGSTRSYVAGNFLLRATAPPSILQLYAELEEVTSTGNRADGWSVAMNQTKIAG
ncbi:hypothetical protein [Neorhizobium galegae]|uniref:hypothetical protein n=1 Tax=Neorhizobium galegae TaxID=399 RepID=UPI0012D61AFC|nr:hypothetical protein [Neorhizobium galegae]KAB1120018.1 hypothetical protein F4V90_31150 [Neorhizobium galegae]MCQ1810641.1 hypothetical protein [Neorhizobium galegae]